MDGSPIEVHPLSAEDCSRMRSLFDSVDKYGQSFVRTNPGNCIVTVAYEKWKDYIKNFALKEGDVCLLTYPKCGTTWMQELITLVKSGFDIEKTHTTPIVGKGVMLDFPFFMDVARKDGLQIEKLFDDMLKVPSPRLVASHLPFTLLPDDLFDKCKVVICLRNPKDTAVSKYNFEKLIKTLGFVGDFPAYFDLFMDDKSPYGSYFEFVKMAWEKRHYPNVCMLFFEEMKKDLGANVRKVAKFLGVDFTDEQIDQSVDFLSFKKMKERENTKARQTTIQKEGSDGHVMRKGEAGDWKNIFTDEMSKRMDETIEKHFKPIGLEFQYD